MVSFFLPASSPSAPGRVAFASASTETQANRQNHGQSQIRELDSSILAAPPAPKFHTKSTENPDVNTDLTRNPHLSPEKPKKKSHEFGT
jgi:hypothetical protein